MKQLDKNKISMYLLILSFIIIVFQFYLLIKPDISSTQTKGSKEEYIWVSTMTGDPMFTENDIPAFRKFGEEKNVTTTIMGPREYDITGQIEALEEAIAKKPAGILVLGMEQSLAPTINKAMQKGIPVITVDSDVQSSSRIAFVGSNWYDIGVAQAESMVKLIGGQGKIAIMGIGGADTTEAAFDGYYSVIENYPDITIVGEYDDMANSDESARITAQVLETYPDIAGFSGFNSNSACGIAQGIRDNAPEKDIKVTAMDIEPANLKLVDSEEVDVIIGQKRSLFTYYGGNFLYDINHSSLTIKDLAEDITDVIPEKTYTGLIKVDRSNLHTYFPGLK